MRIFRSKMLLDRTIEAQAAIIVILWGLLLALPTVSAITWDTKISVAAFIAVPAGVIGVAQLLVAAHIQRASYIKDYALRFRTDKELSESFHYLIYRYGNSLYEAFLTDPDRRSESQKKDLERAQDGVPADLRFFDPRSTAGSQQERRLDNLLGFFNTLGYDLRRKLVHIDDVAGMFGVHLDHFVQRKIVNDYLLEVESNWPKMSSFHERYDAPVPFRDLREMTRAYIEFRSGRGRT